MESFFKSYENNQLFLVACSLGKKKYLLGRLHSVTWFPHTINCLKDILFVEKEKIGDIEHVLTSKRTTL